MLYLLHFQEMASCYCLYLFCQLSGRNSDPLFALKDPVFDFSAHHIVMAGLDPKDYAALHHACALCQTVQVSIHNPHHYSAQSGENVPGYGCGVITHGDCHSCPKGCLKGILGRVVNEGRNIIFMSINPFSCISCPRSGGPSDAAAADDGPLEIYIIKLLQAVSLDRRSLDMDNSAPLGLDLYPALRSPADDRPIYGDKLSGTDGI